MQKIRGNVRRYPDGWGEAAPLTGLLYCADCGGKMYVHRTNNGKTYFAMRLAAACTNRKPLPGMETLEPFNIIYQTAEDGLGDTVKPRLMEAEADLERVLVIDDRDTPLTLADERIATISTHPILTSETNWT